MSSPRCCNYVLQKTSIDNEAIYGEKATKTLLYSFYLDNFLKSVENEKIPVNQWYQNCCLKHMAKFIANKKVSQSVQKYYRKNGVKNANLDTRLVLKKSIKTLLGQIKKYFQI